MRRSLWLIILSLLPLRAMAGLYGEHKLIGDGGFEKFLDADASRRTFFRTQLGQFGMGTVLQPQISEGLTAFLTKNGTYGPYSLTYGDVNGIAGDHSRDPIEIYYGLLPADMALFELNREGCANAIDGNGEVTAKQVRVLQQQLVDAVKLHHNAILLGGKAAGNFDFGWYYIMLSYEDQSHFRSFGKTTEEELAVMDNALRQTLLDYSDNLFCQREGMIDRLNKVTVVVKYTILHTIAMQAMHNAGVFWDSKPEAARSFFVKGLLFNAFADHYLEDMFAAGHLVIDRRPLEPLNDNGAHDYFCRVGLDVHNARGDKWHSYGDGYISYGETTYNYGVEAVATSLGEIWDEFQTTRAQKAKGVIEASPMEKLAADTMSDREAVAYLMEQYKIFRIIPYPDRLSDVNFGDSRAGAIAAVSAGGFEKSQSNGYFGFGVGLALKFGMPDQDVTDHESSLVMAALFSYRNASWLKDSGAAAWHDWQLGAEATIGSGLQIGVGGGARIYDGVAYGLLNPYVGWEFKPVSWSFAPSIQLNSQFVTRHRPTPSVQVQLRLY